MNNALFVVHAMDGGVAMCAAEGSSEAEARRLARLLASVLYPTICRNFRDLYT